MIIRVIKSTDVVLYGTSSIGKYRFVIFFIKFHIIMIANFHRLCYTYVQMINQEATVVTQFNILITRKMKLLRRHND